MRQRAGVLLAATVIISAGVLAPPAIAATAPEPVRAAEVELIPGQYLVTLDTGMNPQDVLDELGIRPLFVYTDAVIGFAARLSTLQVNLLRKIPGVETVEQDARINVLDTRTSPAPRAVASWGLDRINQRNLPLDAGYTPTHDGSNVTAYIVDTGIDYNHGEFAGRARPGFDAIGDGRNGADCQGHGTHVAGTVGGTTFGVARRVQLVSVRVLGCDGRGTWSGVVAGFDWVAANLRRPAVLNASLGGTPASAAVDAAANGTADRGAFTVVAGGNDTADACNYSPARAARPLTIGATTRTDTYADYSNRGACVQLLAPGTDIVSARLGGGSVPLSGTSMASPHVTGVAALYKQTYGDRGQGEIIQWLVNQASQGRIGSMPANTPNLLLYSGL